MDIKKAMVWMRKASSIKQLTFEESSLSKKCCLHNSINTDVAGLIRCVVVFVCTL
jgi:hypothetical protein